MTRAGSCGALSSRAMGQVCRGRHAPSAPARPSDLVSDGPFTILTNQDFQDAHPWSIDDAKRLIDRAASNGLAGWGFAEQTLPAF